MLTHVKFDDFSCSIIAFKCPTSTFLGGSTYPGTPWFRRLCYLFHGTVFHGTLAIMTQ